MSATTQQYDQANSEQERRLKIADAIQLHGVEAVKTDAIVDALRGSE